MHKVTKVVLGAIVAAMLVLPAAGASASGASGSQSTGSSSSGGGSASSTARSTRAMASHDKQVVRDFVKAANSNNVDRVMSFYTKDAKLYAPPDCNPCKGKALRRTEVQDAADHFHANISQLKVNGDVVTAKFRVTSDSIKKSGHRSETGTVDFTVRGDKIAVVRVHPAQ